MSDGFLSRWSRRKAELREGRRVEPEPVEPALQPSAQPSSASGTGGQAHEAPPPGPRGADPVEAPAPTLDEVRALTPDADFRPFMARGVAPEVKNAAVKKLFADPHFNVMDGLDTYIADYSKPDPLPEAMLRQMASARFLKLVEEGEGDAAQPADARAVAGDDADVPGAPDVAQSGNCNERPGPPAQMDAAATRTEDAHADLRLQPDHAARRESAGPGAS